MLLIPCPYCGARAEIEFSYGAEAHIARPEDPAALSDEEWAQYLFMKDNTKGVLAERWVHTHGCGRWFNLLRDTVTDEILAVYKMGESPPKIANKTYV
ncbi:MAG: sarcosine oxidase subunit delta [Pseudomonadota bacterium]